MIGDRSVLIFSSRHHFSPAFSIFPSQPQKARKMTSEQVFRSLPHTVVETYYSQKDLSTEASALILQARELFSRVVCSGKILSASTNIDQSPRLFPHPCFVLLQADARLLHQKMIAIVFKKCNTNLNVHTFGIFNLFTGKATTPLLGHLECDLVPFSHVIFSLHLMEMSSIISSFW